MGYIAALFQYLTHLERLWLASMVCGQPVVVNLIQVVERKSRLAVDHVFAVAAVVFVVLVA